MPISKDAPCPDGEPLGTDQLFPTRRERRPAVLSKNRLRIAQACPVIAWSNVDPAPVLGRPQSIVEVSHTVHKGGIKVSDPLDDGFRYQHAVPVHRIAGERFLRVRRRLFPRNQPRRLLTAAPSAVGEQPRVGIAGAADNDVGLTPIGGNCPMSLQHPGQCIVIQHGVVVEPQIKVIFLSDRFFKRPSHPAAPK